MPRLSVWQETKSYNYKFIDNRITEMYTVGGVGLLLHKYLGPSDTGPSDDATKPEITTPTERSIQDILFMENRDRKYDTTIYPLRGMYTRADQDFDLSQFGLFLATGTVFMTFPLNEMVRLVGRKIMAGDVLELMNLVDDYADVADVPMALKRFYVVTDCSWPAEGFSPLWYPHLWRAKLTPLVDSQEYKSILTGMTVPGTSTPILDVISNINKYTEINTAIVAQAETDVPKSGYDTSAFYTPAETVDGTPVTSQYNDYLTGDGLAPDGFPVTSGISFPSTPTINQYFLRLDFLPNRLFRYDGARWNKVEDSVRTSLTKGDPTNKTMKDSFIDNANSYTNQAGVVHPELQSLNNIFKAKPG